MRCNFLGKEVFASVFCLLLVTGYTGCGDNSSSGSEFCGDNVAEGEEACDGTDLKGMTCESFGYSGGVLSCGDDCSGFDFTGCTGGDPVCGNGVLEQGEECDGDDLGDRTCQDEGFDGGDLGCTANCEHDTTECFNDTPAECGNGILEEGEECDGDDFGGETCDGLGYDSGDLGCTDACMLDTSECIEIQPECGNGILEEGEECDAEDLGDRTCQDEGFDGGDLGCTANCEYDTTECFNDTPAECGNGAAEEGEECDGDDFGGETCVGLGFDGGDLICTANCEYDTTECFNDTPAECGNGIAEGGEECDGVDYGGETCVGLGFDGGDLLCTANCEYDTTECINDTPAECGNGIAEEGEECDGVDYGGETCVGLGFDGGDLLCTANCEYDTTECFNDTPAECGNGIAEEGEECDGDDFGGETCGGLGYDGGDLACTLDCMLVESGCYFDSSCDNSGDCDTCIECANSNECSDQYNACGNSGDCINYANCASSCTDEACYDACDAQYPDGSTLYWEYVYCLYCEGCYYDCDGEGAGCPGPVPGEWTCNPDYYGANDGCDCGCGVVDPDCADSTVASCDYCNETGSCDQSGQGCPGDIDPDNNAICVGNEICDNSGDCDTCVECANSNECADQYNACANSGDCINYANCASTCTDEACLDTCDAQYPDGSTLYWEWVYCIYCEGCYNDCDGAGAGC